MKLRLSPQTLLVLDAFSQDSLEWKYGYEISRGTGLKSGTLYPILMRMAERALLETAWEKAEEPGRPARHMYRLTPEGQSYALEQRRAAVKTTGERAAGLTPGSLSEAQS
jgi:PadR family transcriptional regulator, regulatory protein PadR